MEGALYLTDSYIRECDSQVVNVKDGKYIILDKTCFYPRGGGLPSDIGKIINNSGSEFKVVGVTKAEGLILHELETQDSGLKIDDKVKCIIDWERRYKLMRMHTAAHALVGIMNKEAGVLITGNQIEENQSRIDFNLENPTRELIEEYIKKTNQALKTNVEIKIYFMPRDEALKREGMVKLAGALPPDIKELRILEIPGIDIQADGGPHVKNTSEVGELELIKLENKGKNNRRIYFKLNHQSSHQNY